MFEIKISKYEIRSVNWHTVFHLQKPSDYKFEYGVSDPHTGDHKSQWEIKENGVVQGEYRLLEPDGTTRIVQYTADDIHGFRAVVKKIGHAVHPPSIKHATVSPSSVIVPQIENEYNTVPYYKSYDGSGDNYVNNLPLQLKNLGELGQRYLSLPQNIQSAEDEAVYHSVKENQQSLENRAEQTLSHIPYSFPSEISPHYFYPSTDGIIKKDAITSYVDKTSYIAENIPSASSEQMPSQLIGQVLSSPILENSDYSSHSPQVQNGLNYVLGDQQSSLVESLLKGIRIDHPYGESSSSFYSTTGNIEDDSVYKSHTTDDFTPNW